jgi:hypothetical protein
MCFRPYRITRSNEYEKPFKGYLQFKHNPHVIVSCGVCPDCKSRRVSDWVFRLQVEERNSSSAYFITLTYDDDHVPLIENNGITLQTLNPKDLTDYWKRLRYHDDNNNIKYYACGEYGGQTSRPHYHAIVFNVKDKNNILKAWSLKSENNPMGFVDIGTVTGSSIAYVCKYVDKRRFGEIQDLDYVDPRVPEYSVNSNGLGKSYLTESIIKYYKDDLTRVTVRNFEEKDIPMPRYYRKKIYSPSEMWWQNMYIQSITYGNELEKLKEYATEEEYYQYKDRALLKKQNRFKRSIRRRKSI